MKVEREVRGEGRWGSKDKPRVGAEGTDGEMESGFTASSTVVHEHTILQSHRVNMRGNKQMMNE